MGKMRMGKKYRKRNILYSFIASAMIVCLLLTALDARIRPIINTISSSQARNISTRLINEAVTEVLKENGTTYDELVNVETDSDGNVTSIQVNTVALNTLKSELSTAVAEKIAEIDQNVIKIPIGTLLGSDLLSGRGYKIKVKLALSGNVMTDFSSAFVSKGINQTYHQIMLNVKTSIYAIITGYSTCTDIDTSVSIAETVIVGKVPDAYTSVDVLEDDVDEGIDDLINNYGAVVE